MLFVHSGNEYSAILRNGDVIKFEDEREAQAVQAMYEDVQAVLGRVQSDTSSVSQSEPPSPTRYAGEGMKKALA